MTLLDRYLTREVFRLWGLIMGAMVIVSQIFEIFTRLRRYADHPLPPGPFVVYLALHFAQTLLVLAPVSLLLAMVVSLGLLGSRRELVAMRSVGLSPHRMALPLLACAILISGVLMAANWTMIPLATQHAERIKNVVLLQRPPTSLFGQNRTWLQLDAHRLMNIQLVHPTQDALFGVSLYELNDDFSLKRLIEATAIKYRQAQWWVTDGIKREFHSDLSLVTTVLHDAAIDLPTRPDEFREVVIDPDEMDGPQLHRYIEQLQRSGLESRRHEINYHAKLALPAVNVLLVLVGIPLGLRGGRWAHVARSTALAVLIGIGYALVHAYAIALGNQGALTPVVAAWTANALLLLLGGTLYLRMR